ncbi:MAG: hypothetical protein FLDDKLPJ_02769 [Phycisphaerae bacterium]|nr:hypothetical protein [Phycisphaerae bacterium]
MILRGTTTHSADSSPQVHAPGSRCRVTPDHKFMRFQRPPNRSRMETQASQICETIRSRPDDAGRLRRARSFRNPHSASGLENRFAATTLRRRRRRADNDIAPAPTLRDRAERGSRPAWHRQIGGSEFEPTGRGRRASCYAADGVRPVTLRTKMVWRGASAGLVEAASGRPRLMPQPLRLTGAASAPADRTRSRIRFRRC